MNQRSINDQSITDQESINGHAMINKSWNQCFCFNVSQGFWGQGMGISKTNDQWLINGQSMINQGSINGQPMINQRPINHQWRIDQWPNNGQQILESIILL